MPPPFPLDPESLRENKREMFDGMRAYHQSEISHSNHAITMLLAIAGAAGAVVLAMLFPQYPPEHLREISYGLLFVVSVLSLTVAFTSHLKITSDHVAYEAFGEEYVKTSQSLEFYNDVPINGRTTQIKTNERIGKGQGYRKTQRIIWAFAIELVILTFLFAVLSCHFAPESKRGDSESPPVPVPQGQKGR